MNGLAEYPGYVCYDASRPSWLPNWLDTWGESVCKLKQAPANVGACLNPLATSCAPDSYVNANVFSGKPNTDPNVSGAGILGTDEGSNAPPGLMQTLGANFPDLSFNPGNALLWVGLGVAALVFLRR